MFKVIDCLNKTRYLLISKPNEIAQNSNITQLLCASITVTLLHFLSLGDYWSKISAFK